MKEMGLVTGSADQAKPLIVGFDTVYVHKNIVPYQDDRGFVGYQYEETQYTKDEYIALLSEKHDSLESELTKTQVALTEVYEGKE